MNYIQIGPSYQRKPAKNAPTKLVSYKAIIFAVKALEKKLRDSKSLIFIDLEGTQISHEAIEIGAWKVYLKDDLTVKKIFRPFKTYIKPMHKVGPVVTDMTGITDKKLEEEGVSFRLAQQGFRKYVGSDWFRSLFVAYGSQDIVMFKNSVENNPDAYVEDVRFMAHHYFDFADFLSSYVKDDKGNVLSLTHACEMLQAPMVGKNHDALSDARNLVSLYSAFLEQKTLIEERYLLILSRGGVASPSLKRAATALASGKDVSAQDFRQWIKEELS